MEKEQEEKSRKRLELFKMQEEETHRVLVAESKEEKRIRMEHRNEAAKHEKHAEELLEKQLELRKYDKKIKNSLDAVKLEKVKVQDEIELSQRMAAKERENRLAWEKSEAERLEKEKKYLEEE
jgi:hypothetical protein